jgi:hypothetical protein
MEEKPHGPTPEELAAADEQTLQEIADEKQSQGDATGEPYGGEEFDYAYELQRMGFVMQLAQTIRIDECESHLSRVHAIGPIQDPTAYRDGMQNLEDQGRMIRAFRPLVEESRKLIAEAQERKAKASQSPQQGERHG